MVRRRYRRLCFVFIPASQPGGIPLNEVFFAAAVVAMSLMSSLSGGIVEALWFAVDRLADLTFRPFTHLITREPWTYLKLRLLLYLLHLLDIGLYSSKYPLRFLIS
jgi:hypothetical protein